MRDDKLAKLLFLVGCAGLPWLWAVHLMYFAGKRRRAALGQEEPSQSGLLDGETLIVDDEPGDPAEIELEAKKWVRREFFALVMVSLAWLTWIIVFQVLRDYFPAGWLVRGEDESEVTGW